MLPRYNGWWTQGARIDTIGSCALSEIQKAAVASYASIRLQPAGGCKAALSHVCPLSLPGPLSFFL